MSDENMIGEYKLLGPFQSKNAGFCRWTFAEKDKKKYFIKELFDPIYPIDDSISEELKSKIKEECKLYERQKIKIYKQINEASDGNLVRIEEFFRYGSHYYLIMEKVVDSKICVSDMARFPLEERMTFLLVLSHSMMLLEKAGIVHADLKEENIILYRTPKGKCVGKIIDFDCAFSESSPPSQDEELGGDQVYISPEYLRFLFNEEVKLTSKMDVFSLGILFHQCLTGKLPEYDNDEYGCIAEAVLDASEIKLSFEISSDMQVLIRKMLDADPDKRPRCEGVYEYLTQLVFNERTKMVRENPVPDIIEIPYLKPKEKAEEKNESNVSMNKYFHMPDSKNINDR